jgi:poly-gamma-glutamate capsule biosynthesis protein CapA/YwtB (metallophosphatase superfamily)
MVTLFLCGDVMLGRGVDQILPYAGHPELRERHVRDARDYVRLAERHNGPIPAPVDPAWLWGDALDLLDAADVRVVNLETSITESGEFTPSKAIHYRMHPANVAALTVARPDVCVLANNHVLDFGAAGLEETLDTLARVRVTVAGAGRTAEEACRPAAVPIGSDRRLLVYARGMPSSGIPPSWAATDSRPGIAFVDEPSDSAAAQLAERVRRDKRRGDIAVVSVHWGSNWGYDVPGAHVRFAHALIDGGVDVVHGHSSHHPRPMELHHGRLILYSCGDFVDDYEGITGYEQYRDDLRLAWLVAIDTATGNVDDVRIVPFRARRMRLEHAPSPDRAWLCTTLDRISASFGSQVTPGPDGTFRLS